MASLITATGFAGSAQALVLDLDFGNVSDQTFNQAGDLRIDYFGVSAGVNATLFAQDPFDSLAPSNNGSVQDDVRVNTNVGENVYLTLQLWDADSGSGFDTVYDPGTDFEWTLTFYDIDGGSGTYDEVTLITPGSYTVTSTTDLEISTTADGLKFSGVNTEAIPGQSGLSSFTQEQADVAVGYTVQNSATVEFIYHVRQSTSPTGERNLLVDGGELRTAFDPYNPVSSPFPEPSAAVLVISGISLLATARRRRRAST